MESSGARAYDSLPETARRDDVAIERIHLELSLRDDERAGAPVVKRVTEPCSLATRRAARKRPHRGRTGVAQGLPLLHEILARVVGELAFASSFRADEKDVVVAVTVAREGDPASIR